MLLNNDKVTTNSNEVFTEVSLDKYQKIKQFITEIFRVYQKQSSSFITDLFEIKTMDGKITFTFYQNNKLMVQSNPNNKDFINIIKKISAIVSINPKKQNNIVSPLEEDKLEFDYYIGCDESGRGETFGFLYLGCTLIKKENLKLIKDTINNKNIRKLNKNKIEEIKNSLRSKYDFLHREYSPDEIDKYSLNMLLDSGYKFLLSKIIEHKKNLIIAIDDYGIGNELKGYIKTIENDDVKVIVKNKADEEYTACKIASLVARAFRANEIEKLNTRYVLIEDSTGDKVYPCSGSSSNNNTDKYLILFRKKNPYSDFPLFVRKKWNNVKSIDTKYPKQQNKFFFTCDMCFEELSLLKIRYSNNKTRFFCSKCDNLIKVDYFKTKFNKCTIVIDTSVIITRIISKNLSSTNYLHGNNFILPSFVYDELDNKGPNLKKGGLNEINTLKEYKIKGLIDFNDYDTTFLEPKLSNDEKILAVIINRNAILLTKDATMTSFGLINNLVMRVEGL